MKITVKKIVIYIITILFIIIILIFGKLLYHSSTADVTNQDIIIEQGSSLLDISDNLLKQGFIDNRSLFIIGAKLLGTTHKINAGVYVANLSMSYLDIYRLITSKNWEKRYFVIKEGSSLKNISADFESTLLIKHKFNLSSESKIIQDLNLSSSKLEGWLYPDSYLIVPGQTDTSIIANAVKLMQSQLDFAWKSKNKNTVYKNKYEMLIMASLIEKEASQYVDMQKISTVFNNRLRINMPLQDDPAVFYGLNNPTNVYRKDFKIYTPYNTYMNKGLPPTPICMPSKAALLAAAKPLDDQSVLYFVAMLDGNIVYSKSYNIHKQNANKYFQQKQNLKLKKGF